MATGLEDFMECDDFAAHIQREANLTWPCVGPGDDRVVVETVEYAVPPATL